MHHRTIDWRSRTPRGRSRVPLRALGVALAVSMLPVLAGTEASTAGAAVHARHAESASTARNVTPYPQGRWDLKEPSHRAPVGPYALPGYSRVFVSDFRTWLTNKQWFLFRGVP